jgi:hypothetical protein
MMMKNAPKNRRLPLRASIVASASIALISSADAAHVYHWNGKDGEKHYSRQAAAIMPARQLQDWESTSPKLFLVADNDATATDKLEPPPEEDADLQALRQKMIKDCQSNRGVDCEQQVDTELQAEQSDGDQTVIRHPTRRR